MKGCSVIEPHATVLIGICPLHHHLSHCQAKAKRDQELYANQKEYLKTEAEVREHKGKKGDGGRVK